jgi:flagellar motility protein MotE (MotC chaperone)
MFDAGFDYGLYGLISTVINLVLGGGFVLTFLTLRAQRKKATAEAAGAEAQAESIELDNVEKAVRIWREIAEGVTAELKQQRAFNDQLNQKLEALQKQVEALNCQNKRIVKLLDKITHENLAEVVNQMKDVLNKRYETNT